MQYRVGWSVATRVACCHNTHARSDSRAYYTEVIPMAKKRAAKKKAAKKAPAKKAGKKKAAKKKAARKM